MLVAKAFETSQKVPLGATFTDIISEHEPAEKETSSGFGPFADLFDQYVSVCNEIVSLFVCTVVRLFETINNISSPVELFTNLCIFLLTVIFSLIRFVVYETFYLITLPFRIFITLLISHPIVLAIILFFSLLTFAVFIIIIKQISIAKLCRATIRLLAPYCFRFAHTLFLYLCPQYCLFVSALHLLLTPVKFFWSLFSNFLLMFPVSMRRPRQRRISDCTADDVSRIMCCICFINEKSIMLQPCNHICVCADCVEDLLEAYEEPLCPLCRALIASYIDVYI